MTKFEEWIKQVAIGLTKRMACDGEEYIRQTGHECWKEMFNEGLSPEEAVSEEVYAAASMI